MSSSKKTINPMDLPVTKDSETVRKTVLSTLVSIFKHRGVLNPAKWTEDYTASYVEKRTDDSVYVINIDNPFPERDNGDFKNGVVSTKVIVVKLIAQNVTSVSSPIVDNFLKNYADKYKIVVFDKVSDRAKKVFKSYKYMEVFTEKFLMQDLLEHHCSPQYEVLTDEQILEVKRSYNVDNRKIQKISAADPVCEYLGLRRGQFIRIIRNSEQTCHKPDYRRIR